MYKSLSFDQSIKLVIRAATPADSAGVTKLLDDYARVTSASAAEVKSKKSSFRKFGFSEQKCFDCHLGVVDELIVSYVIFSVRYSAQYDAPVLHLEDLFVDPRYRNQGYGQMMLARIKEIAK